MGSLSNKLEKNKKFRYLFTFAVGMIIGILIGSTLLNVLVSYRVDQYHEEIKFLQGIIQDRNIKLEKLEESINKSRFILSDISIILQYHENELSEIDGIELEKHIKEKYVALLGKEVKKIDIDMVEQIIDNRIMKLGKNEYKLKINKITLTDVLELSIEVILQE